MHRYGSWGRDRIVRGIPFAATPIMVLTILSDYSGNHTKLSKILLNGNNICMVRYSLTDHLNQGADVQKLIPGGEGPTASG